MSGGSMDYLFGKVLDAHFEATTLERKAFSNHLIKVALALKAIEWNDSGDGADNESELIRACIPPSAPLEEAVNKAHDAIRQLKSELEMIQMNDSIKVYEDK